MSVPSVEPVSPLLPSGRLPGLRLLPVPVCEPPYDDERAAGAAPAPGLVAGLASPVGPLRDLAPAPLRLLPALTDDDEEPVPTGRTATTALPPAQPVARALVQGLLEVLAGVRPVAQLQRSTSPELFGELESFLHSRPRNTTGSRPPTGAVRSLHVQQRPDGVAEVCATVQRGPRAAAIALRLEGLGGRWCCTQVAGLQRLSCAAGPRGSA